ncbi:MAG: hypothetical protein QJR02_07215 [Sinobacteraceae bacterium]|nr:hypothetical protein [Nevskiaceae bacterium]
MITDAQYAAWLRDARARRCLLLEMQTVSRGQRATRCLSNTVYVSRPTDNPPNVSYEDRVRGALAFSSTIDGSSGTGTIEIANYGDLDAWLDDSWLGWPLTVLFGDPSWSRADFRQIAAGISNGMTAPDRGKLSLALYDVRQLFQVPALKTSADGQLIPLALGTVFNAKPILIDPINLIYQVHNGPLDAITDVRDRGVSVVHTDNLQLGTFQLAAPPAGDVTCDIVESHSTAAQMLRYLAGLVDYRQIAPDLDTFPNVAPLGLYVTSQTNVGDLMTQVANTVGAVWLPDRLGRVRLVRLADPASIAPPDGAQTGYGHGGYGAGGYGTGTPAISLLSLSADDLLQNQISVASVESPQRSVQLAYRKNWYPMNGSQLAGGVDATAAHSYQVAYSLATASNDVANVYPLAAQPDVVETLFVEQADAQAEADRRAALRAVPRKVYALTANLAPLSIALGDVVRFTHPRFGFDAGAPAMVVGLTERPAQNQVDLQLWR